VKASVIVPSFRRFEPLLNTVSDLQQQSYPDYEIIVIDQNPKWPQELQQRLEAICQDSKIVWLKQQRSQVVIARNFGVEQASGDILIFVDDDVKIADPEFVRKHVDNYQNPEIDIVTGRECPPDSDPSSIASEAERDAGSSPRAASMQHLSPLKQALWFDRNSASRTEVCTFSTCNGSLRKQAFLAVGGFDESFGGNAYGDDHDLVLRLNALGYKSIYDPSAWLVHLRVPMGGLRMTDVQNRPERINTAAGFWLFLLRHGDRSTYGHLLYRHVLRKTVLLKINVYRPWRQLFVIPAVLAGMVKALVLLNRGPTSCFQDRSL